MDHYAKAYPIFSRIRGYRGFIKMLYSLREFSDSEAAEQRIRIIKFYEQLWREGNEGCIWGRQEGNKPVEEGKNRDRHYLS